MRIKCCIQKIKSFSLASDGFLAFTRGLLPSFLINKAPSDTDELSFELNLENKECFIKHMHTWKNIHTQNGFIINDYYIAFTTPKIDINPETTLFDEGKFDHYAESETVDKLAFLYKSTYDPKRFAPAELNVYMPKNSTFIPSVTSNAQQTHEKKAMAHLPESEPLLNQICKERTSQ